MYILFAVTIFLGAALLFMVQPLFARMVLPLLGGSPAVWNTAMVFFQAALLAGYGYVHFTTKLAGLRRQMTLHVGLLLLPLLVLPIAVPGGWSPPTQSNPIPWLLMLLTVAVGFPFIVVATTSPLLQKWFAASGHPLAKDPYFLYAASNLGSMVGLLTYPIVLEPRLQLHQQSLLWTVGYVVLVCLVAICAVLVRRAGNGEAKSPVAETDDSAALTNGRRARWVLLAFAPSSLMLGVTTYLSTDIAAVPLLWVVPLAVYLLTFILVFARRPPLPHRWMARALPFAVLPLTIALGARATNPMWLLATGHLLTLFVAGMVCHGELAQVRPAPRHLTEFYLWMSVGGVLGGMFNALVAPVLFTAVLEYPITLALACTLGPALAAPAKDERRARLLDVAIPLALALIATNAVPLLLLFEGLSVKASMTIKFCVPALVCFAFRHRPLRFGLGVGAVLFAGLWLPGEQGRQLYAERSFFGIHRVSMDPTGKYHRLYHGSTIHGAQYIDPAGQREPLGYYGRRGPVGQVFATFSGPAQKQRIALVGLGAGTLAAYAEPGEQWTAYEIDPAVSRIAANTNFFTYLSSSPVPVKIELGDARLRLAATTATYDLILLDAYNSDAVPVHLLTRQAIHLYVDRLAPDGLLAFHISNRYLDLEPVVAQLAADAGLVCRVRDDKEGSHADELPGTKLSTWAVMARRDEHLGPLAADPRWEPARARPDTRLWTDDYSSIFSVFRRL